MSTSVLEIIELASGEIVLKRGGDNNNEPLVNIRFSEESKAYLGEAEMEVAKVMLQAGIQAAAHITEKRRAAEEGVEHVLH